jgi:hypothetical protein
MGPHSVASPAGQSGISPGRHSGISSLGLAWGGGGAADGTTGRSTGGTAIGEGGATGPVWGTNLHLGGDPCNLSRKVAQFSHIAFVGLYCPLRSSLKFPVRRWSV